MCRSGGSTGAIIASLVLALSLWPATASEAMVVCPEGAIQQGVDVSRWQGTVDWSQVAASGVAFAFARVSDGLSADAYFAANYAGIRAAGMIRGACQMFRPGEDPLAQADLLLAAVGILGHGDLPPALEVAVTDDQTPATIGARVQAWTDAVRDATGRTPIILTSRAFWDDSVTLSGPPPGLLWVANWGVTCPDLPDAWTEWALWQYTDAGAVPGITGIVARDGFNGPFSELQQLAGGAAVAVPSAGVLAVSACPNPFNPKTTIRFALPAAGWVRLAIYDVAGRPVRVLVEGEAAAGSHEAAWDGRDRAGRALASGSYLARLETGGAPQTVRLSLVR